MWLGRAAGTSSSLSRTLKPWKAATAGSKRAKCGQGPLGRRKMNKPAGLPSMTMATASVPRPSPYPGFQNSWYSLGINLQTHAPGFCFPPFPSIPLLSSESAPCESPGPDLTGHLVHLGGPVKPCHPVRAWRGGAGVDGQTLSRQAEARHGQARRGRRLARVQGDQGPLEAAVSQGSCQPRQL